MLQVAEESGWVRKPEEKWLHPERESRNSSYMKIGPNALWAGTIGLESDWQWAGRKSACSLGPCRAERGSPTEGEGSVAGVRQAA